MADPGTVPASTAVVDGAVKPYKIHIPNKYLDQVKKKLELTRLPHEGSEPKSHDWWEPKPLVEPLIDFWLDKYNWRDQENILNDTLPQYRTAITLPPLASPIRLHFIHVRSPHEQAVPLLLIPPFPFTNLSFGHLVKPLTDPEDPVTHQPFNLVIPSLPGLGFSDALPNNLSPIPATAEIFDTLMTTRLSYPKYIVSGASPGHLSPAEIDWKLINRLSTRYTNSCIGAHFISPPLEAPKFSDNAWEYLKWSVANFFHAEILGYTVEDFQALDRIYRTPVGGGSHSTLLSSASNSGSSERLSISDSEPNTLAYALCDSPSGMLAFVLKALRGLAPSEDSTFSQEQLVTLTNLAWLPGPEYAMRFWAHCKAHREGGVTDNIEEGDKKVKSSTRAKPFVAITVFTGDTRTTSTATATATGGKTSAAEVDVEATAEAGKDKEDVKKGEKEKETKPVVRGSGILLAPATEQPGGIRLTGPESVVETTTATATRGTTRPGRRTTERYICPAWANSRYNVVHTQRASGKVGGLLAFERPDAILDGVRGLTRGLLSLSENPFKASPALTTTAEKGTSGPGEADGRGEGVVAPLESVVVVPSSSPPATTTALTAPALPHATTLTRTTTPTVPGFGKKLPTLDEEKTSPKLDKGKGKEVESPPSPTPVRPAASPPPPATTTGFLSPPQLPRDRSFGDGESPDTLVEGVDNNKKKSSTSHSTSNNSPSPSPSPLMGDNATLVSPSSLEPSPSRSPLG